MTSFEHIPTDAVLAMAVRRSTAQRRAASEGTVALLRRLAADRFAPGEAERLSAALSAWDAATAEEGAVTLFDASGPTVLITSATATPDEAAAAGRAIAGHLSQGHLALIAERLGLRPAGPPAEPIEVAVASDRVAFARGTAARDVLARAAGPNLATRREVHALAQEGGAHLVHLGAASPTKLVALVAGAFGQRFTALSAAARRATTSENAVWSATVAARTLRLDLRVPPPELRALAAAVRGEAP
jgi:hypothetical protein